MIRLIMLAVIFGTLAPEPQGFSLVVTPPAYMQVYLFDPHPGTDYYCDIAIMEVYTGAIQQYFLYDWRWLSNGDMVISGVVDLPVGRYQILVKDQGLLYWSVCYTRGGVGWYSLVRDTMIFRVYKTYVSPVAAQ